MNKRCVWVPKNNIKYQEYHDKEWGVPVFNDRKIFKYIVLESAQAGLSWAIILNKGIHYSILFHKFSAVKVAEMTSKDVSRLLKDQRIIRNRQKIEAAINNAKIFLKIQKEFGSFSKYMWGFCKNKQITHKIIKLNDYPKTILEAVSLAKDLKTRGFKFFGPTIVYAHMQAIGMVNDHIVGCFRRKACNLIKTVKT